MTRYKHHSMQPEQLLVVCGNVLAQSLLEAQRADAKRIFNDINDGKRLALVKIQMDEETEVRFDLLLDHSEYRGGRLNFKAFRSSIAGLIQSMRENFEQKSQIPVFTEQQSGAMLFAVPGVTREDEQLNVMMLSLNLREPGCVQLKLMYMDPNQFSRTGDSAQSGA